MGGMSHCRKSRYDGKIFVADFGKYSQQQEYFQTKYTIISRVESERNPAEMAYINYKF